MDAESRVQNPEQDCLHFTKRQYPRKKYEYNYSPSSYRQVVGRTGLFSLSMATSVGEGKL